MYIYICTYIYIYIYTYTHMCGLDDHFDNLHFISSLATN